MARHCKKCGQEGHYAKTCKVVVNEVEKEPSVLKCIKCGDVANATGDGLPCKIEGCEGFYQEEKPIEI